jgi:hypothetical protein
MNLFRIESPRKVVSYINPSEIISIIEDELCLNIGYHHANIMMSNGEKFCDERDLETIIYDLKNM